MLGWSFGCFVAGANDLCGRALLNPQVNWARGRLRGEDVGGRGLLGTSYGNDPGQQSREESSGDAHGELLRDGVATVRQFRCTFNSNAADLS